MRSDDPLSGLGERAGLRLARSVERTGRWSWRKVGVPGPRPYSMVRSRARWVEGEQKGDRTMGRSDEGHVIGVEDPDRICSIRIELCPAIESAFILRLSQASRDGQPLRSWPDKRT
jgi:hypothetical protein